MHWTRLALVLLIAAVLQLVLNSFLNFAFRPDLIVIAMVFFVCNTEGLWPIISAFSCGFAADLVSSMAMGPHTIGFGIAGSLLAVARRSVSIDNPVFVAIAVFLTCCIGEAVAQIMIGFRQPTPAGAYTGLLWMALASAVIGPYIYSILSAAGAFLGTRQRSGRRGK
jgi:rod shape-determining protein MreD